MKNFGLGKKWVAGNIVGRLGTVNYHVVLFDGFKLMHRHVDQLIARIPDLGVDQEAVDMQEISNPSTQISVSEDNPRRSQRERKSPAWMEDYRV